MTSPAPDGPPQPVMVISESAYPIRILDAEAVRPPQEGGHPAWDLAAIVEALAGTVGIAEVVRKER